MKKTADVIIIGGGIMGCSSAYHLSKAGLKVTLLEKRYVGDGPTGKSSAIIRQHYSHKITASMAFHSLKIFHNFKDEVGDECGFNHTGFLNVVSEKDLEGLKLNVQLQQSLGINTKVISGEEIAEVMPGLVTNDPLYAAYEPDGGYADAYLTVGAYARAAKKLGAEIVQKAEVTAIRRSGDKVVGVDSSKGQFDAPVILSATGAWAKGVGQMVDLDLPINSCRVQVAYFHRPGDMKGYHPVVADFVKASYFRPEGTDLTVAGLIDPAEANAVVDPDEYDEGVNLDFVTEVGEKIMYRYPDMEKSESRGGYASLYAVTPDWHAIVDELPQGSGYYVCSGFSGHGFKLGPAVGLMVADFITGNSTPKFDHTLFRFSRFEEKETMEGRYQYSIVG
ncbi:MAG: FAD-dependent oxidoreductase [Candidatus Marinimicrobia bacterium]|jgi:glycine/D-amino acid oxidase-like deaminating enzyme|nr:FAD-dependent oxidoreductase [Candidatus Neomarinimicrobiota bacterium]|tara:strand:+ start:3855 stop:5030 length:1176 start_codon:yes stop_codon:yes gene_type:complete